MVGRIQGRGTYPDSPTRNQSKPGSRGFARSRGAGSRCGERSRRASQALRDSQWSVDLVPAIAGKPGRQVGRCVSDLRAKSELSRSGGRSLLGDRSFRRGPTRGGGGGGRGTGCRGGTSGAARLDWV